MCTVIKVMLYDLHRNLFSLFPFFDFHFRCTEIKHYLKRICNFELCTSWEKCFPSKLILIVTRCAEINVLRSLFLYFSIQREFRQCETIFINGLLSIVHRWVNGVPTLPRYPLDPRLLKSSLVNLPWNSPQERTASIVFRRVVVYALPPVQLLLTVRNFAPLVYGPFIPPLHRPSQGWKYCCYYILWNSKWIKI